MKKIRTLLIILIIILLVMLIVISITKKNESKNEIVYEEAFGTEKPYEASFKEISFKEYETIKSCLQKYVNTLNIDNSAYYGLNENNEYIKVIDETKIKQKIYNLISKEFIEKNNIKVEEIYDYVEVYKDNKVVTPIKISKIVLENRSSYFAHAIISSTSSENSNTEIKFIVNIDNDKKLFSIEPLDITKEVEDIKLKNLKLNIEKKENNTFLDIQIKQEDIATGYFTNYKNILLSRPDIAYNFLNEEYKQKRFENLEMFKKYINKNKGILEKIRIVSYEYTIGEEENQYVCLDQFNNSYIFNEKSTLDYNVILDLYTIDLPQFIEKYDSSNTQEKVLLNIEKIEQALNYGDYKYVYSKLADSFKSNKFKTQKVFEEYIKDELYNNITIEYKEFSNEGNTYIYDVGIKNLENEEDKEINMQIIMQLKEERDFVMSFSIK